MRWIKSAIATYLVLALGFSPAGAVVVNIGTFDGYQDAPQNATPVGHITLFLRHSNGKVYRADTDSRGVARVDVPPGTITRCQAFSGDQLISSWACNIPVGDKATRLALKDARTQTEEDTPLAADSNPRAVTALAQKDGSLTFFGFDPLLNIYLITAVVLIARYLTLIQNTWSITHDYLMTNFMATALTYYVLIFFGQLISVTGSGGDGGQGGGGD